MSPTAKSLAYLRKQGFLCAVVESWIPRCNLRRDLFGFADILAVNSVNKKFLLVQTTSLGNVSARLKKARGRHELLIWLRAGGRFAVHGWDGNDLKVVGVNERGMARVLVSKNRRKTRSRYHQPDLFEANGTTRGAKR